MRFTSLTMNNYRPYSIFRLDFNKTKETDLHAIIASNGVGKTSLLNAIEWCLYGIEPHLGSENTLPICNMEALRQAAEGRKDHEKTRVVIDATEGTTTLKFERTVNVQTHSPYFAEQSVLKVFKTEKNSQTQIFTGEEANEVIRGYLPQNIKEYFFFDSEQLSGYFNTNMNVKGSIYEVAQISVVSSTKDHLNKVIRAIREEIGKINPAVDSINKEIAEKETAKENLEEETKTLKKEVDMADEQIAKLNSSLKGSEQAVDIRKKYEANQEKLDELDKDEKDLDQKLLKLVRSYYHPMMLYDVNKEVYDYINSKKERGKLPPDVDIALIKQSLKEGKCAVCGEDITTKSEEHLNEMLNKLEISTSASNVLMEIKNDLKREVEMIESYKDDKDEIYTAKKRINTQRKELEDENKELKKQLHSDEDLSQIASWMSDRDDLKKLKENNKQKIWANTSKIEELKNDLQTLDVKLKKANRDSEKHADLSRELYYANDALKIVTEIESAIILDVKNAMEKETMSLFEQLIWKKNTYDRISLTDSYELELFTKDSDVSCLGSCSAAETQLLALAFTIALHRVSGHEAPLVIDTPVGRVSDKNRENFAQTLVEVSKSKQIIMSFTPSEYSSEVSHYFDHALSSKRMLSLDNERTVQ